MIFYLDTSALLKRYMQEVGSGWLTALATPTIGNTFATALITKVEAAAGLAAKFRQGGLLLAHLIQAAQNEGLAVDNPNWHP
jgi:uncharacterized protein